MRSQIAQTVEVVWRPASLDALARWGPLAIPLAVFLILALPVLNYPLGTPYGDTGVWAARTVAALSPTIGERDLFGFQEWARSPLYGWAMALWLRVFGVTDLALRAFNVLLGMGAIAVFYALFRRFVSPWVAGLAVLIAALNPYAVLNFVQVVNYDNPLPLLGGMTVLAAWGAWSRARWGVVLGLLALTLVTKTIAVVVVAPLLMVAIQRGWPRYALASIVAVPVVVFLTIQVVAELIGARGPFQMYLGWTILDLDSSGRSLLGTIGRHQTGGDGPGALGLLMSGDYWRWTWNGLVRYFTFSFLALAAIGLIVSGRRFPMLAVWTASAILFTIAIGYGDSYGSHLTATFLGGFFAAQAVLWAIRSLQSRPREARSAAFAIAGIGILLLTPFVVRASIEADRDILDRRHYPAALKEAAAYIAPHLEDGEVVGWSGGAGEWRLVIWYLATSGFQEAVRFMEEGDHRVIVSSARQPLAEAQHLFDSYAVSAAFHDEGVSAYVLDLNSPLAVSPWETVWEADNAAWTHRIAGTVTQEPDAVNLTAAAPVRPNDYYSIVYALPEPQDWSDAATLSFDLSTTLRQGDVGSYVVLRTAEGSHLAGFRIPTDDEWTHVGINMENFNLDGLVESVGLTFVTGEASPPFDAWIRDVKVEALARP